MEVKRWYFIVTSAMKSNAVVCDAYCKQKDYVPLICVCVISNFFLKISLHISVVKKPREQIMAVSSAADISRQHIQIRFLKLWQLALAAINSSKCSLHMVLTPQLMPPRYELPSYCPYSLWYWNGTHIIFLHIEWGFPLTPESNDFQNKVYTFNSVWTDVTFWRSSYFRDPTRKRCLVL